MKKLFLILTISSLSLIAANATEQDAVNRSAVTVREFRHMPEKGIPPRILGRALGFAIISVVKAGLIFSGKPEKEWSWHEPDMADRDRPLSVLAEPVGDRRSARK